MPQEEADNLFDSELIELHLGGLTLEQRTVLLRRIAADARFARQNDELQSAFAALGSMRAAPPIPDGLVERTARRVRAAAAALRLARSADAVPDAPPRYARLTTFRDVLAVAATVVLLVGIGVPGLLRARQREQRIACSVNLARLGQGLSLYGTTFADSLPFAGWGSDKSWQPTSEAGIQRLPNRAHAYRLLLAGSVRDPAWFVCPARGDVPMASDQVRRYSSFAEPRNVSYGYQNMAGVRPTLNDHPDLPIMADDNPLFDDGLWIGLAFGPGANSRAHGGTGQNVLTLGGRVRWMSTPDCGVDGDNIWTLRGLRVYTGREGPKSASDSHLIK